ncbi:MAG: esterase-like activity of phytase family protein, partial [Acidobacteria bacterium]|nr:esterase-like activity of phytase family protein [Acidobacteriota bacterium]
MSSKVDRIRLTLSLIGCLFALAPSPGRAASLSRLEFLGSAEVAAGLEVQGAVFGGISGLAYYPAANLYFGVSDDQGQYGPVRFFSIKLDLSDGRLSDGDVAVTAVTPLFETPDRPIGRFEADAESIVLAPGGLLYISSEGNVRRGIDPFLRAFSLTGMPEGELTIPRRYRPKSDGSAGIRHNLGFEGLALSPDSAHLFVVTENALAQDGPQADVGTRSPSRILKIDIQRDRVVGEYVAWVDAVTRSPQPAGELRTRGLVEILALSDTTLLGLEREFVQGVGHDIVLNEISLEGADDVSGRNQIDASEVRAASKERLFDFSDLGLRLDNLEAMCFGPTLPDGRRTLIVASDDNFSSEQRTLFLAFAVDLRPLSPSSIQGAGHRSPFTDDYVVALEGVVTAAARSQDVPR